jgi:hypothetical protein
MKKSSASKVSFLTILAVIFSLLTATTAATQQADPVATVIVQTDAVLVQPQVKGAGYTLTIAGPDDFYLQQELESGASFTFSATDKAGKALPDGVYQYEIRALSSVAPASYDAAQRGLIPVAQAPVQSGSFSILDGSFVLPDVAEEGAVEQTNAPVLPNDQVILDDLIVVASSCIGHDCVNGEDFGYDTLRLKENNLRIHFHDTSNPSSSFPTNDWRISVNDSSAGGANYFAIQDVDAGRNVFVVKAGARSNALYINQYGRVGLGTSTPAVELEIRDGDTPSVRLHQDSSYGWEPQTWDVAGNEANFFIRDVTNGSELPFRIQPGAPYDALTIKSSGYVGVGTWSPDVPLEVYGDNIVALKLVNTGGGVAFQLDSDDDGNFWNVTAQAGATGNFVINNNDGAGTEFTLTDAGDLTIEGDYYSTTCTGSPCAPDYVFEDDYPLMSLEELEAFIKQNKHLPNVPSENDLREAGVINNSQFQMVLLEKIEELTLYTLQQQQIIEELEARLAALESE